jgi:hypothetical protein
MSLQVFLQQPFAFRFSTQRLSDHR